MYTRRVANFWTCGFFPGSIWALVERATKYPQSMRHGDTRILLATVRNKLEALGLQWSEPLSRQAYRTDTHDLGFMILPHMRRRWELFHSKEALSTIITAATSLYSRFNTRVGAIRAWDVMHWVRGSEIYCTKENFLVIVDSLCNLELLYYAAAHSGYTYLADAATTHAKTLLKTHLRPEPERTRDGYQGMLYSSSHVVNFVPATGEIQKIFTAQGHAASTTWSRGQAWAIIGYAQAFSWTKDEAFLEAALGCAEYFLLRLENAPSCVEVLKKSPGDAQTTPPVVPLTRGSAGTGRYVPLWDFDAPIENEANPLRDASAGVAAANGMLILTQLLMARGCAAQADRYLQSALVIVEDTLLLCLSEEECLLETKPGVDVAVAGRDPAKAAFQSILTGSTVSWNEKFTSRTGDHGLVYADYYLIEFGNRLLQLGHTVF